MVYSVTDSESREQVALRAIHAAKDMAEYFYYMGEKTLRLTAVAPIDTLTELQQRILNSVPEKFQTGDGVFRAVKNGLKEHLKIS